MEVEKAWRELVEKAARSKASDIHIMPELDTYKVYYRYSNSLSLEKELSIGDGVRLLSYLKFVANMDVGEKRRPQSGAVDIELGDEGKLNIRLSTIADYKGRESLVIRLIAEAGDLDLASHTLNPEAIPKLEKLVLFRSGFILFSGPVSSGKTTTMYQLVRNSIRDDHRQVISIEDPVEIEEEHFLQTQVNSSASITYDLLVRQSLRHHPDILIIGEIRDEMTAQSALRAALTGHLVLATLHAKNSQGVVARLEDLGLSRELLQQTVIGVIFQKMLPRYCKLCQADSKPSCDHIDLSRKKAVLYDVCVGEKLKALYSKRECEDGFNIELRRAYDYGYISKESYDTYFIP